MAHTFYSTKLSNFKSPLKANLLSISECCCCASYKMKKVLKATKITLSVKIILAKPRLYSLLTALLFSLNTLQCHLAGKLFLLKFLGHLWCKNPHSGGESVSALLQVQCLHIANACLGSMTGKSVKELAKTTCTGG